MKSNIIRLLIFIISIFSSTATFSQKISIDIPPFAGKEWSLVEHVGSIKDTVQSGILNHEGLAEITLSDKPNNQKIIVLTFTGGVELEILVSGKENIKIHLEGEMLPGNIKYISTENNFLIDRYKDQNSILMKIEAMIIASDAYKNDAKLYPIFQKELNVQENAYNTFQKEIASNSSYASRILEIINVKNILPNSIGEGATHLLIKDFIVNNLDISALYRSGMWNDIISQWLDWYEYNPDKESLLKEDYKTIHSRIPTVEIRDMFKGTVMNTLQEKGRSDLAFLTQDYKAKPLKQGNLDHKKTILVFYDSDCGFCVIEMQNLSDEYDQIEEKGYQVISISSDLNKEAYETHSSTFPWKQKYCDFTGIEGEDFINYRVGATPTFFLIAEDGSIEGIYARVKDIQY